MRKAGESPAIDFKDFDSPPRFWSSNFRLRFKVNFFIASLIRMSSIKGANWAAWEGAS